MAPQNLTNNDDFCPYYESSCVNQHFLMLAGTPDGNFFLQWREKPAYNYVFKIYNDSTGTLSPTYSLINAASESEYIGNITLTAWRITGTSLPGVMKTSYASRKMIVPGRQNSVTSSSTAMAVLPIP